MQPERNHATQEGEGNESFRQLMQNEERYHKGAEHDRDKDSQTDLDCARNEHQERADRFKSSSEVAEPLTQTDVIEEHNPRRIWSCCEFG